MTLSQVNTTSATSSPANNDDNNNEMAKRNINKPSSNSPHKTHKILSAVQGFFHRVGASKCPPAEEDDDATVCTEEDECPSQTSPISEMTRDRRLALLRFCVNMHPTLKLDPETTTSPTPKTKTPISVWSFPNRLGVRHPSEKRDVRSQWSSLMRIGRDEMKRDPKNCATALMAWNEALAVRVRNYYHFQPDPHQPISTPEGLQQEKDKQQEIAKTLNCIGVALCEQDMDRNEFMAYDAFEKSLQMLQDVKGAGDEDCAEVVHNMWIMLHNVTERANQERENDREAAIENTRTATTTETPDSFYPQELDSFRGLQ